ncbi:hypothetical protein HCU64_07155 [Methylobacterium sp. C25]|uniref:hypothetical protein n=1 Tax=Methylobacterium sp. C25 TaxID=2721622 RepID=UPI001F1AFF50|nr:hypothetical protein [Methylobacterium sp. C25]MCE4223523.1 hypothetical protein [Methylobacterium sp. C25]
MKTTIATVLIVGSLTGLAPAAQARDGISAGGAAALGVLGGLAVGGAIASSNNDYYPGRPVYRAPRPVYVEEDVGPVCHFERRRYIDAYGDVLFRRVRVCE